MFFTKQTFGKNFEIKKPPEKIQMVKYYEIDVSFTLPIPISKGGN